MNHDFSPHAFFRNRHLQTIISSVFISAPELQRAQRLWIPVEEGVFLEAKLDRVDNPKAAVILLHGLAGNAESRLSRSMAAHLLKSGYDTVRLSLRGFENSGMFPTLFNFGKVEDLGKTVQYLRNRGYARVMMVGNSLSAGFMLNWMRLSPGLIDSAVVISPPMDLLDTIQQIDHPRNRIYRYFFVKALAGMIARKKIAFPQRFAGVDTSCALSVSDCENGATIPFYGLKNLETYYSENSFHGKWNEIQDPLLVVHANDDPILGSMETYFSKLQGEKHIEMKISRFGGHAGFYGGLFNGSMIEKWISSYFDRLLAAKEEKVTEVLPILSSDDQLGVAI